ncbi:MAG TPA: hypothetical protein VHF92_07935 [Geodermatophilus sp.]|nr:hypothetical protein [Geodermatophilus sp.]
MSETEENRRRAQDVSEAGARPSEPDASTSPGGSGGGDKTELSDTGVGLGAGEPNTFEPEEAAPAPEAPAD